MEESSNFDEDRKQYKLLEQGEVVKLKEPLEGTQKCYEDLHRLYCYNKSTLSKHTNLNSFMKIAETLMKTLQDTNFENTAVDIFLKNIEIEISYGVNKGHGSITHIWATLEEDGEFQIKTFSPDRKQYKLLEQGDVAKLKEPLEGTQKCYEDLHRLYCYNKSTMSKHTNLNSFMKIAEPLMKTLQDTNFENTAVGIIFKNIEIEILYGVNKGHGSITHIWVTLDEDGEFQIKTFSPKTWKKVVSDVLLHIHVPPHVLPYVLLCVVLAFYFRRNPDKLLKLLQYILDVLKIIKEIHKLLTG